jgi:hypothetical protein
VGVAEATEQPDAVNEPASWAGHPVAGGDQYSAAPLFGYGVSVAAEELA